MPTSDESWSGKLRVIGDLERPDHTYLAMDDDCAFFGEYTPRAGFAHSKTNGLINNLKKPMNTRGSAQWRYKGIAIREVGTAIARNLTASALASTVFVPIPPSRLPTSADYDDRMLQVARAIGLNVDVRDVLVTVTEREARHLNHNRRDLDELRQSLGYRQGAGDGAAPSQVILLDDVLTTGCSFRVCKAMINDLWPGAEVYGLFVARRVPVQENPFADFDVEVDF